MSVNNIVEPAAPITDASTEPIKLSIGALYRRKSAFSRKLKFFERDMIRYKELLQKIKDEKFVAKDEMDPEESKKFTDVIIGYKMLRSLCISSNWIACQKEDDKRFIPSKFEEKLKTILGD
jgi:hypothetical protein